MQTLLDEMVQKIKTDDLLDFFYKEDQVSEEQHLRTSVVVQKQKNKILAYSPAPPLTIHHPPSTIHHPPSSGQ